MQQAMDFSLFLLQGSITPLPNWLTYYLQQCTFNCHSCQSPVSELVMLVLINMCVLGHFVDTLDG